MAMSDGGVPGGGGGGGDYSLARSHPLCGRRLGDAVFGQLCERGYAIVPSYLPQRQVQLMRAALETLMPTYEARCEAGSAEVLRAQPDRMPAGGSGVAARQRPSRDTIWFPYKEQVLNHAIINDPEALAFAERWLGTDQLHYRPGIGIGTYPGFTTDDRGHIDNGNNSLLPPASHDRRHSQLIFWFYLSDVVDATMAPTLMWPTIVTEAEGPVRLCEQPEAFLGTAGALCIFTNYTYHAASPYTKLEGQRYVWKHAWGRADFPHEGTAHYTMFGSDPSLRQFIPQISPRQRCYFRFPAPGDSYYTAATLRALERQYPGFDSDGTYLRAAAASAARTRAAANHTNVSEEMGGGDRHCGWALPFARL
jgi:hypothetical protein